MSHEHGAYLGGIRCIEDIRQRCVMDDETGCWHLRTARGRVFPKGDGRTQRIWVHGRGAVSATRAVWELAHGHQMQAGRRAMRTCDSYDCANPAHISALRESQAMALQAGKDRAAADAALANLIADYGDVAAYQVAQVQALRNDADATFEWLERARANRDPGVGNTMIDPLVMRYKEDPRLAAFCETVGLPPPTESQTKGL